MYTMETTGGAQQKSVVTTDEKSHPRTKSMDPVSDLSPWVLSLHLAGFMSFSHTPNTKAYLNRHHRLGYVNVCKLV